MVEHRLVGDAGEPGDVGADDGVFVIIEAAVDAAFAAGADERVDEARERLLLRHGGGGTENDARDLDESRDKTTHRAMSASSSL